MAQMSFEPGEGMVGHVAASGNLAVVKDTQADAWRDEESAEVQRALESEGISSFLHIPVEVSGEVFGVFNVSFSEPLALGHHEKRLFVALSQRAALAIENAQLYEQAQQAAVLEERQRLARDLHDAVTQTLFSASIIAEVLPVLWESDEEEGRQMLRELQQLSRGALAEMRTLLLELRPAALAEANLPDLLRQLSEAASGRTGVPVTVNLEGECDFSRDVHAALYRVAQEALNNVVKHARPEQVEVRLSCTTTGGGSQRVELSISDDGCGFDPGLVTPNHLGLGIMRERTRAIGAELRIASVPGMGTRIVVVWVSG
jgi:two-component system nitrate/nitrite sensor histidine kinase NarX